MHPRAAGAGIEQADHHRDSSGHRRAVVAQRCRADSSHRHSAADPRLPLRPVASLLPLAGMHLSPGTMCCAGTLEPRKNLGVLFEATPAFRLTSQRFPLVVAGMAGWHTDALDGLGPPTDGYWASCACWAMCPTHCCRCCMPGAAFAFPLALRRLWPAAAGAPPAGVPVLVSSTTRRCRKWWATPAPNWPTRTMWTPCAPALLACWTTRAGAQQPGRLLAFGGRGRL